ncbi:hypothetical protein COCOBI_03-0430 [Coccomyxa sp. Obi]|nr:hypothetical protein COCOBI_03-0430 [Coccomyxa sp. Obi]
MESSTICKSSQFLLPRASLCRTFFGQSKVASVPRLRQSRPSPRTRHAVRTQAAFGAKAKTANQVYLCIDCGYIYDGRVPFAELEKDYRCPVCQAPKRRFKAQKQPASNSRTSSRRGTVQPASGEGVDKSDTPVLLAGGVGILVVVAAVYFYLNSQF